MDLRTWQTLAEPRWAPLIEQACAALPGDLRAIERLRAACPDPALVRTALTLAAARLKARDKFSARAASLWADPAGVEMASSPLAAAYKARRCASAGGKTIDICCGIGGDAMALAGVMPVEGVDADAVRAWMFSMNTSCPSRCADAADVDPSGHIVHIDPARRDEATGTRRHGLRACQPPIERIADLAARARAAVIKLGPGVDHADVRTLLPPGELEFVSERGRLTQAVLWIGDDLRPSVGQHRATLLAGSGGDVGTHADAALTLLGVPGPADDLPPSTSPPRFLLEPDDSVERAGLLGELCRALGTQMLHPAAGLLTSDRAVASGWVTVFEVLAEMPWNIRRVREHLRDAGAGIVEVKTRGKAVDPDTLQAQLRGDGDHTMTVFVLRLGAAMRAFVARRVSCCPRSPAESLPPS